MNAGRIEETTCPDCGDRVISNPAGLFDLTTRVWHECAGADRPCGCPGDYHLADCPILTDRSGDAYQDPGYDRFYGEDDDR